MDKERSFGVPEMSLKYDLLYLMVCLCYPSDSVSEYGIITFAFCKVDNLVHSF